MGQSQQPATPAERLLVGPSALGEERAPRAPIEPLELWSCWELTQRKLHAVLLLQADAAGLMKQNPFNYTPR